MSASPDQSIARPARAAALLALLAAATCAAAALAQTAPPARPPASPPSGQAGGPAQPVPAPVVIEPALIDFGEVEPSSKLPAKFTVRNTGSAPLTVAMVLPSCKCTTTQSYAGTVIPPGEAMELDATMDAPSVPGFKDAKINIVFNGYNRPSVASLRCEVLLPIKAREEYVDALKGVTKGTLTIESRDGKPFRILSSNGEPPSFVGFDPAVDEPRSSYTINWSVEGWPCEGMRLWWIVETDRPDCPILPCRIRHECTGMKADPNHRQRTWIFKEQVVNAGKIKAGQPARLKLEVENGEPKAGPNKPAQMNPSFKQISSVKSLSPDAAAKMVSCVPRGEDEAVVYFDFTPRADYKGLLYSLVEVDSPTGPGKIAVVASVE